MSENKPAAGSKREQNSRSRPLRRVIAWGVHLLTASGIVCCLLAVEAGRAEKWQEALAWLMLAILVDAVDGTFARVIRVKQILPNFDGTLLDNTIDYVSFVFVPALLMHWAKLLPEQLSLPTAAAACVASAFQFCQADAKTSDHFFKGFPSYWNVVVLYLLVLGLDPTVNLAIVGALVVLVFVPVKYLYPSRTPHFQKCTLALTFVWSAMICVILWQMPRPSAWLVHVSLLYLAYYVAMSLFLTFQPRRRGS